MNHTCKNQNCKGIENYCINSSHPLVYLCDCKEARKHHNGHAVSIMDLGLFDDCISRVQDECLCKKKEFTFRAYECIDKILGTLNHYNSELEEVIQKCNQIKQESGLPDKRLGALEKYIDLANPEEKLRKVLDPKVDKLGFYMRIQR